MMMKTHLIVTGQEDSYDVKDVGRLIDCNLALNSDGFPVFVLISNMGRREIPTFDVMGLTEIAKKFTAPKGRGSVTTDKCWIYVKTVDKGEVMLTIVTHNHIRYYAPMYDDVPLE